MGNIENVTTISTPKNDALVTAILTDGRFPVISSDLYHQGTIPVKCYRCGVLYRAIAKALLLVNVLLTNSHLMPGG